MKYCIYCGKQINDAAVFCEFCGGKQLSAENNRTKILPENKREKDPFQDVSAASNHLDKVEEDAEDTMSTADLFPVAEYEGLEVGESIEDEYENYYEPSRRLADFALILTILGIVGLLVSFATRSPLFLANVGITSIVSITLAIIYLKKGGRWKENKAITSLVISTFLIAYIVSVCIFNKNNLALFGAIVLIIILCGFLTISVVLTVWTIREIIKERKQSNQNTNGHAFRMVFAFCASIFMVIFCSVVAISEIPKWKDIFIENLSISEESSDNSASTSKTSEATRATTSTTKVSSTEQANNTKKDSANEAQDPLVVFESRILSYLDDVTPSDNLLSQVTYDIVDNFPVLYNLHLAESSVLIMEEKWFASLEFDFGYLYKFCDEGTLGKAVGDAGLRTLYGAAYNNREQFSKKYDIVELFEQAEIELDLSDENEPETVIEEKGIGFIQKYKDFNIGLACIRSLDYVQTALTTNPIEDGHEVLYVILDVENNSSSGKKFDKTQISLYINGVQAIKADGQYLLLAIDNLKEYNSYEIDPKKKVFAFEAFDVEKGWEELEIYYDSELKWSVSKDDINVDGFDETSLYKTLKYTPTEVGSVIYSMDYEIVYDGLDIHETSHSFQDKMYAVFKFTINNTSASTLDYSLVGYNMRGYRNGYLLSDSEYVMDDIVDGYINVFDVDEIVPGKSAKIYVAFSIKHLEGTFACAFDTGYGFDDFKAMVYDLK